MRVTIFLAFLALAACKHSESQPAKVAPPPERHGFVQELDGHRAVIVKEGDLTFVIPFDDVVPGTLIVDGHGGVTPMKSDFTLPGGGGICPCCVRGCGSPCEPVALPCEPLPSIKEWPGGFGRSLPQ